MTGRRKDPIWQYFEEIKLCDAKVNRAKCKTCNTMLVGLVARMKLHHKKCVNDTQKNLILSTSATMKAKETVTMDINIIEEGKFLFFYC